jgi:hypothetical protein
LGLIKIDFMPEGIQERLQVLLDRQDIGEESTSAEGLVELAEFLSLRLRSQWAARLRYQAATFHITHILSGAAGG